MLYSFSDKMGEKLENIFLLEYENYFSKQRNALHTHKKKKKRKKNKKVNSATALTLNAYFFL